MAASSKSLISLCVLILSFVSSVALAAEDTAKWEEWVREKVAGEEAPVVQNKRVLKKGRFQLMGPLFGLSDRKDFYNTTILTLAGRYHLSERHSIEFARISYTWPRASNLISEIEQNTGYRTDVQLARYQFSAGYVYSPIYGKYAWGESSLVYFDIYGLLSAGARFAVKAQPMGELGLGMNHYIYKQSLALVPEFRFRFYFEDRTEKVFVRDNVLQLGVSWLL